MLAWQLCDFSGDPDQYCYETLYFAIFSRGGGGSGPMSPRDPRMKLVTVGPPANHHSQKAFCLKADSGPKLYAG